jgi:hypothetical protein
MGKLYEIIVFTASPRFYADRIIDHIDPQRIIAHRLYREHCIHYQKRMYLKNLRILGRDLNNVIFVDVPTHLFRTTIWHNFCNPPPSTRSNPFTGRKTTT